MSDAHGQHEIRCPIHGFIYFNDWEKAVIDSPEFQRLRRIRQLAFTEFIYPGATHTRFEHSLGVMHVATRMYDALTRHCRDEFVEKFRYDDGGFERDRQLLRFAALLHDIGHGPLSHASEDLMPFQSGGQRYKHEQYSAAIVRSRLRSTIDRHPLSENSNLKADEIADFLEGKMASKRRVFWRDLLDGQMDADRADYLLRDSHHAGVAYGRYDSANGSLPWNRPGSPGTRSARQTFRWPCQTVSSRCPRYRASSGTCARPISNWSSCGPRTPTRHAPSSRA